MSDLDLGVHYVRTPAGAKRYHRPIGAPIGVWPDKPHVGVRLAAKSSVATLKTGHLIHKGLTELPQEQRDKAVRALREALRGKKGVLTGTSNQTLLRIALDPRQHGRIRAEAKKELANRVVDVAKTNKLHREAAKKAMIAGETPNSFLGIGGPELTQFQKALIAANPKYGKAFVKVLQRLHQTPTFRKFAKGRHVAKEAVGEHIKHTKEGAVHKGINMAAFAVGGALASHVLKGLGMDPNEAIKAALEWVKEAAV